MMVVLTLHVGASTYFNISKCSHASLHPGKAGSCKQPLSEQSAEIDANENLIIDLAINNTQYSYANAVNLDSSDMSEKLIRKTDEINVQPKSKV